MKSEASGWNRGVLLLALGFTAFRLVAAGSIHLTEDESYYRLWAMHPQLGYLDHPPMIAWWIAAGETIFGDTPLGVRLVPSFAAGLTTWLIADLARRLGAKPHTAFRAALWYNATLTVCLGGMLAIPDAPASLFWIITLWSLARFWDSKNAAWWLAAGAAAGLAVMSKYSALFLAPGVLLWLMLVPAGREELRKPGPWIAAGVAGLIFSPNVIWNAQNHWLTFTKQFGRVAPHGIGLGHLAEFLGDQILVFTPLMAIYATIGVWQGWRERAEPGAVRLILPVATSAPFAFYLLIHSLHDRVQGHWPAPLFGALAISAAMVAERFGKTPRGRVLRAMAPAAGYLIGAAAFAVMALPTPTFLGPLDPTKPLRGWPQFARDVEAQRVRTGARWVGTNSYGMFAQLNDEHATSAPLLELIERDRYWAADPGRPDFTQPGLVVDLSRRLTPHDIARCFTQVDFVGEILRGGGLSHDQHYSTYLVSGPRRDVWITGCPAQISPGVWR